MNVFVCLTLIAPRSLRDELFDYLSGQEDIVSGFTASEAAGHGRDAKLQTPAERVRGEAEEVLVRMILREPDATRLLDRLKEAFAGSRLVYWLMPVTQFGLIDGPES
ncbi:DUF3240 family protein [Roseiarcaceae bacterium H3SJ34-1]|uniref:DUF3240 family protein n=1 Tax=Terripilifer ovatus TaxID=3032367 RepID=UPI003AB9A111|nr:DUF3240 family protein [Roseiarcaceae bacterium H3SJ34-1]